MKNQIIPSLQPPLSEWEKGWYTGRYKRLECEKRALESGGGLIPPALNGPGNLEEHFSLGWKAGFNSNLESEEHNIFAITLHQESA